MIWSVGMKCQVECEGAGGVRVWIVRWIVRMECEEACEYGLSGGV